MIGGIAGSAVAVWFGPERQSALDDFFAVYEANIELAAVLPAISGPSEVERLASDITAGKASPDLRTVLRRAIDGDWASFEETLRLLGATYAHRNFSEWHALMTAFSRRLIPRMVDAYVDTPDRLAASLVIMKEFFDRVGETLRTAYAATLEAKNDATTRASAEALRQSDEAHRSLFEMNPAPLCVFDTTTLRFLAVNDAMVRHYGYARDEFLAMRLPDIKVDDDLDLASRAAAAETGWVGTRSHWKKDRTVIRVEITSRPLTFRGQAGRLAAVQDVTQRENLEAQLRQANKMEAIGSLAGGVAHDFNNLLSVILSYSNLLAEELRVDDPMREDLSQIHAAGTRAAELTRQLLAFSRQQVLQPTRVCLNETVQGIESMLRRVIGEDVELTVIGSPSLPKVTLDPGQIAQVIMNLSVNARDAMPRGGTLSIETAEVDLDATFAAEHTGIAPGRHVRLTFSDSGEGMDQETQARMFEPFFTTKEVGKGTGLGLSTVFGIVRQSGGTIWVYSELGKGTTIKLYFPVADSAARTSVPPPRSARKPLRGTETILLVEDEERVRILARTILRKSGYEVLEAKNGAEALVICEEQEGTIHLLLTDVVMPAVSGRQLAERLLSIRPSMRVLYMSGYTDDAIVRHGILDSTLAFLQKPITPGALNDKVREVLDDGARR